MMDSPVQKAEHKRLVHTPVRLKHTHLLYTLQVLQVSMTFTVITLSHALFSRMNMYESSSLFQNWMQIEFEIQILIILQIIMFCK